MNADELDIFGEAMDISSAADRLAYLDQVCDGDPGLRRRVEKLLSVHDTMGGGSRFLENVTAMPGAADPTGSKVGPYQLLQKIGEGGWGIVYQAEQTAPVRRRVALKIIKPGTDSRQVLARFEAERQALAMMDHPNIARVLDAGATEAGHPYFVMELVRGVRITDYCDQKRLTTAQRLELFIQVCHAIQHAHQKGIIHRDIKPSNILVSEEDGKAVPKVIDFGIAKATADLQLTDKTLYTQAGFFIGTPAYMSPEQALRGGSDIDTRSDVYALGVLLYELLTGRTPFDGEELLRSGLDTLRRTIGETDPARPSTRLRSITVAEQSRLAGLRSTEPARLVSSLQGDLDWIVLKALEKDRTRRYESAGALAMDVRRHLDDEAVMAHAPGNWTAFHKLVRRHRAFFYPAFAAAAALVVGLGIATVLFFQERAARERAVEAEHKQGQLRGEADAARELVQVQAEKSRRQLVQLNVSSGNRLAEAGGYHAALLWFVEAMRLERGDAAAEDVHRRRYAALMRFAPRLEAAWPLPGVFDVEFTADGKRIIGRSGDDRGCVWDATSGEALAEPGAMQKEWFRGDFKDGTGMIEDTSSGLALAALAAADGISVFDLYAGRETGTFLAAPEGARRAWFSRDGKRAAAVDAQKNLYRWQLPESEPLVTPCQATNPVTYLTMSKDGGRIATATGPPEFDVLVWDFAAPEPLLHLKKPAGDVMVARISPDGKLVAVGSWDRYARLYDAKTGAAVGDIMPHVRGVGTLDFSPNSRLLATAGWDATARLWDTATGRAVSPSLYHAGYVPVVVFSPDGTRLATVCQDEMVRLWNVQEARTAPARLTLRHGGALDAAKLSPDGRFVVTAGRDKRLKFWSMADGALLADCPQAAFITRLAFSPDKQLLAAGFEDGRVELLEAATGKLVRKTAGHAKFVASVQFNRDGSLLLTASDDGTAAVWRTATGEAAFPPLHHENKVRDAAFSDDGQLLATGCRDKTARLWNVHTGAPAGPPLRHPSGVQTVAFSPDGARLLVAVADTSQEVRAAQIWKVATGEPAGPPLQHRDGVLYAGFSPDGAYAVTCGEDTFAVVWDTLTSEALTPPLRHGSYVSKAVFSPDSRLLLTLSSDNTGRVWDARTGEPVTPPLPHDNAVDDGQWTADGREVITVSLDGTARVWDVSPASGTLEQLQRDAGLFSSHRLQPGLGIVPLSAAEIRERWEAVRAR